MASVTEQSQSFAQQWAGLSAEEQAAFVAAQYALAIEGIKHAGGNEACSTANFATLVGVVRYYCGEHTTVYSLYVLADDLGIPLASLQDYLFRNDGLAGHALGPTIIANMSEIHPPREPGEQAYWDLAEIF